VGEQLHVIVARFPSLLQAQDAVNAIEDDGIKLADRIVIEKLADGRLDIVESKDAGGGRGFVYGAVATGVLEVLAGPVGWTMLAGGVAGGLAAKFHDAGVPTKSIEDLGQSLAVGHAAVVTVARDGDEKAVEGRLYNFGAEIVSVTVTDKLRTALEEPAPKA
jgi:uncharacterized membrane protein